MSQMKQVQVLRIVVASPGDVQAERDTIEEVAAELNRGIAADRNLHIEISRWETGAFPGFHDKGPQGLIDSILRIEDCDLLIGIFWKRFGTPIVDAKSGTEHEFRIAYEAWKRNSRPQIMVYFNQKPYTPKSEAELEQWRQVLEFKSAYSKEGLLWPYKGKAQFERLVRDHLTQFIRRHPEPKPPAPMTPEKMTGNEPTSPTLAARKFIGRPPLTDPRTIQQREQTVQEIYTKLTRPNITGVVLTGIGGLGKSTLAALVYHYAEKERLMQKGPFTTQALWLKIDDAVTMTDLGVTLLEALGKPSQDFSHLDPQSQALALFNALNTAEKERLIVLDQFEDLLDWQTGRALASRPGVAEWLDLLNAEQCTCRILLTSRPRPQGTRPTPMTYLQEYPIDGMRIAEGIDLLRKQGVTQMQGTDVELRTAVERCSGHALSLTLLATILHDHNLNLATLFKNPTYAQLWAGDIATNLLDYIYTKQLIVEQRKLLLAFSVYHEAVALDAAEALIDFGAEFPKSHIQSALRTLMTQHILQASGEGRYQLHAIIADFAKNHFDEYDEQANKSALQAAHARAAQYYLQQAAAVCPLREQRQAIKDVQPLIEAVRQYCEAGQWQEAYDLMEKEWIFEDLNRWGGNAILLELYNLLLASGTPKIEYSQKALIYYHLGWIYRDMGKNEDSLTYYKEVLRLYKETEIQLEEGGILTGLGLAYNALGQKQEALKCFEQSLHVYRKTKNRKGESTSLNNLGLVYDSLGQKQEALQYFEKALAIRQEFGDRRGEGTTLNNLGSVYYSLGQKQEALQYFEKALAIRQEFGGRRGEGASLNNLGEVYSSLGQMQEALQYFEKALAIRREVGDRYGEGITLWKIGSLYFDQTRYDIALACFLLARSILTEVQSRDRDNVQTLIDQLHSKVGEKQFAALLAQVELQASRIVEQALNEGLN